MPVKAPATATITRRFFKIEKGKQVAVPEGAKDEQETLEVRLFQTVPAEVGLAFGLTINLGNFEGARVDVSLKMPCYAEEKDDCYEHVLSWVGERVQKEAHEARVEAASRRSGNLFG
jgi:hypothetical protein